MFLDDFKAEAAEALDDLKEAGKDIAKGGEVELRRIYENRSEYLDKAGNLGKKALGEAQKKLDEAFEDVKKKAAKKRTPAKKKAAPKKKAPTKKKPAGKRVAKK